MTSSPQYHSGSDASSTFDSPEPTVYEHSFSGFESRKTFSENSILRSFWATDVSAQPAKVPAKPCHPISTLQNLVIKLACSHLSDLSINERLYPAIGANLGAGATFSVERREAKGRKLVAVKHIQQDRSGPNGYSYSAQTRQRLEAVLTEVQALLHLGSLQHPNIIELLGFGWDEGALPYITLEFADLGTLDKFLAGNPLSWPQKEQIMVHLASALELIHACEIIHGDVKLENILVFSDEPNGFNVKLADFGFCCSDVLGQDVYRGTTVMNAPEIRSQRSNNILKTAIDFQKADIYSYGLAVWEIVSNGKRFYSTHPINISLSEGHIERALYFLSGIDSKGSDLSNLVVTYLQSLLLPDAISNRLETVLRMSLARNPLDRPEIRDIRLELDPEDE